MTTEMAYSSKKNTYNTLDQQQKLQQINNFNQHHSK